MVNTVDLVQFWDLFNDLSGVSDMGELICKSIGTIVISELMSISIRTSEGY